MRFSARVLGGIAATVALLGATVGASPDAEAKPPTPDGFVGCYDPYIGYGYASITCSGGHIAYPGYHQFRTIARCGDNRFVSGSLEPLSYGMSIAYCGSSGVQYAYAQPR